MNSLTAPAFVGKSAPSLPFQRATSAIQERIRKLTGSQQRAKLSAVAWGLAAPVVETEVDAMRQRAQTAFKRRRKAVAE